MVKNQLLKGFQDFLPEVMIPRQQMIETIIRVFELYGFLPQDTPALEYAELLMGKYGEDEKLIYRFEDNGGREVALRYDLTVPLARVVAMYRGKLPMPYKRYQISKVWRADKPQKGRFREFVQFDADVVGSKSVITDAEIIAMMCDTMKALKIKNFVVRVNDRGILNLLCNQCKINEGKRPSFLTAIDKLEKIGEDGLGQELTDRGFDQTVLQTIKKFLEVLESSDRIGAMKEFFGSDNTNDASINNLEKIFSDIEARGWKKNVVFDPTIARGLSYYTGTIYETNLVDRPEYGSVISGGRYDKLIKKLGGDDLPAVGTSVGVDRLFSAMQSLDLLPKQKSLTSILIVNLSSGDQPLYGSLAQQLRNAGICCEIFPEPKKILEQFQFADRAKIPFVLLLGEQEKKNKSVTLRMQGTREQEEIPMKEVSIVVQKRIAKKF